MEADEYWNKIKLVGFWRHVAPHIDTPPGFRICECCGFTASHPGFLTEGGLAFTWMLIFNHYHMGEHPGDSHNLTYI